MPQPTARRPSGPNKDEGPGEIVLAASAAAVALDVAVLVSKLPTACRILCGERLRANDAQELPLRALAYNGAPRPMKMGTIASALRYEAIIDLHAPTD
jgi:hypothetical protein